MNSTTLKKVINIEEWIEFNHPRETCTHVGRRGRKTLDRLSVYKIIFVSNDRIFSHFKRKEKTIEYFNPTRPC